MHSLRVVAFVVTLLVCLAAATPVQKRSFKVRARRTVMPRHPDAGAAAMAKAYRKFNFNMAGLKRQNATAPSGTGLVSAVPEPNDAEFISATTVGGQQLNMDFDTGSSDLYAQFLCQNQ